jgi:hypothetical protein
MRRRGDGQRSRNDMMLKEISEVSNLTEFMQKEEMENLNGIEGTI